MIMMQIPDTSRNTLPQMPVLVVFTLTPYRGVHALCRGVEVGQGFSLQLHPAPAWIGGHFCVANEQNTQQSPEFGDNKD